MDLQTLKNNYAQEQGYDDWDEIMFLNSRNPIAVEDHMNEICIRAQKSALEKAADKAVLENTAIKTINTALKYFEEKNHHLIYRRNIISFLHAFHQFEVQGLSIVGMGYKRYDGKEITNLEGAYEGGYFTEKNKESITNPENLIR